MGWKHLGLLYEAGDFLGTFLDQGGGLGLLAMGDWTEPRRPHSLPSFLSISILWKRFKIILHGHDCRFLCQFTSLGRKRLSPGGSWDGEEVLGRGGRVTGPRQVIPIQWPTWTGGFFSGRATFGTHVQAREDLGARRGASDMARHGDSMLDWDSGGRNSSPNSATTTSGLWTGHPTFFGLGVPHVGQRLYIL